MTHLRLEILGLVLLPSAALAATLLAPRTCFAADWPEESAWEPLVALGSPLVDLLDVAEGNSTLDIVGNTEAPPGAWYADLEHLYLRLRVDEYASGFSSSGQGWTFMLDFETTCVFVGALRVQRNLRGGLSADYVHVTDSRPLDRVHFSLPSDDVRMRSVPGVFGGTYDALIDVALPLEEIESVTAWNPSQGIEIALATWRGLDGSVPELIDAAGCFRTSCGAGLPPETIAGPYYIDADLDDLSLFEEREFGTDPESADTDRDGLEDGEEIFTTNTDPLLSDTDGDGLGDLIEINETLTDPRNPDSDGDGLPDGLEVHVTGTDPLLADSDGDGFDDKAEVECGPGPAWDRDADGIPDTEEGPCDTDADGIPDWCDTDSDADGLPDSLEGRGDADGDGIPNNLDRDSDDDGISDAREGTGDQDCDGEPDFLDAFDDGECSRDDDASSNPNDRDGRGDGDDGEGGPSSGGSTRGDTPSGSTCSHAGSGSGVFSALACLLGLLFRCRRHARACAHG